MNSDDYVWKYNKWPKTFNIPHGSNLSISVSIFLLPAHLVRLRRCSWSLPLSLFKTSIGGQNSKQCDPLHDPKPESLPRLFCELNGQVSATHTHGIWMRFRAAEQKSELNKRRANLNSAKEQANPTTKGSRQWHLDHAELPRPPREWGLLKVWQ